MSTYTFNFDVEKDDTGAFVIDWHPDRHSKLMCKVINQLANTSFGGMLNMRNVKVGEWFCTIHSKSDDWSTGGMITLDYVN